MQCQVQVLTDLKRLEQKLKECLEWSDMKLLRAIHVFVETWIWLQKGGSCSDDSEEDLAEVREAVD